MLRRTVYTFLAFSILCPAAYAQSTVTLRTGMHNNYVRAVFDWPQSVPYQIKKTGPGDLVITFNRQSNLAMGSTESSNLIRSISQISGPGQDLSVQFKVPEGATYRDFLVGSRVVIDIMAPKGGSKIAKAASPAHEEPKQEVKAAPVPLAKPVKQPAPSLSPSKAQEHKAEQKQAKVETPVTMPAVKPGKVDSEYVHAVKAEPTVIEQAAPLIDPHVITVSATEEIGMAAFIRGDYLWLVLDHPSLKVPPQIAGEQAKSFAPFERLELKGGVAYRTKLPPGAKDMYIYGEGGGLVWRIVLTPNKRDLKPTEMKRAYTRNEMVRGGTVTWPMLMTGQVLDVTDPSVGDVLKVVTVQQSDQFGGAERDMVDFDMLRSIIGLAFQPAVDDLKVSLTGGGVEVTREDGLALSPIKDVNRSLMREEVQEPNIADQPAEEGKPIRRIFDFDRWLMGGLQALEENQRILLSGMAVKDKNGRVQDLLTLAKMNVANDRGQEAIGFLTYAADELPDIAESPEYQALHGAAAALAGKDEIAFNDLFTPLLKDYSELDYWRAYTLASLEDWQQAKEAMPKDFTVLVGYPLPLLEKIGVKLAEVELRSGDVQTAEGILAVLDKERGHLHPWTIAAMDYLRGEAHRQSGEYKEAEKMWLPLTTGKDDLHRAKAGLALTMMQLDTGEIDKEKAIDRLEGLRYAWRGDELEARINYLLGKLYIEDGRYLKGFTILRDATSMSPDSDIGKEITAYMRSEFQDLLMTNKDMTPLDAVQLYEEFRELTPTGDEGNKLVQKLAERLVEADLLGRATDILKHQVDYRLEGEEKARVAVRLGAISLLDKNARQALKYLQVGRDLYGKLLSGEERKAKLKEIDLLRARGLSQLNRTEEAIDMLNKFDPDPKVNRLRADIAWQAGLWEDAADALNDLILDQALDLNRPLTSDQADLILNYAVALNLSGNRVALNNTREKYGEAMKKTARARLFEVVTRPRNTAILADKKTIESIVNEVDMFKDFLKAYEKDETAVSN